MYNRFGTYSWYKWSWWNICRINDLNITNINFSIIEIWISSSPRDHKSIRITIYVFFGSGKFKYFSIVILCNRIFFFSFKLFFVMKNIIAFLCKHSSMITIYTIDVKIYYNYSLNIIISLGPILCFHSVTRMLYTWKLIIWKN